MKHVLQSMCQGAPSHECRNACKEEKTEASMNIKSAPENDKKKSNESVRSSFAFIRSPYLECRGLALHIRLIRRFTYTYPLTGTHAYMCVYSHVCA